MSARRDKKLVLVVEDEMDMRFFMATLLEINGFDVATARNGGEGISLAAIVQPDLIVLDVMMPEQGGLLMYRRLKSDPKLSSIPVVMLSAIGKGTFDHSLRMLDTNSAEPLPMPEAYIEKPPEPDNVLQTIRRFTYKRK